MEYIDPEFKSALSDSGLDSPEKIWSLAMDRVDDPNRARGGWSEVGRYPLTNAVDGVDVLYIKRQENFTYRPLSNPITTRPTLEKEYDWLRWCDSEGVPSIRPLAYWGFISGGKQRAIMITAGLSQHIPLTEIETPDYRAQTSVGQRRTLLKAIANVISAMHAKGLQHRCLYSKHIFINRDWQSSNRVDVKLIDLEKARSLNWLVRVFAEGVFRDLDSLNRHAQLWTRSERLYFLREYVHDDRVQMKRLAAKLNHSMSSAKDDS